MKKIYFLLFIPVIIFAQSKNPDVIINNVKQAFNKVKDYTVNVDIKVDVSFLKVPEMKAKLYFKQPDKMHIESSSFALLPKDGLYTSPMSFLKNDYTAIFARDEVFNGINTSVIKIIPLNDKGDLILTTLWIDQSKSEIVKVESTTKVNGTFTLILHYGSNKYPLPDSMEFAFNTEKIKMPQLPSDQANNGKKNNSRMVSGKVFISYSNYEVNKGIPDSVFTSKSK